MRIRNPADLVQFITGGPRSISKFYYTGWAPSPAPSFLAVLKRGGSKWRTNRIRNVMKQSTVQKFALIIIYFGLLSALLRRLGTKMHVNWSIYSLELTETAYSTRNSIGIIPCTYFVVSEILKLLVLLPGPAYQLSACFTLLYGRHFISIFRGSSSTHFSFLQNSANK